MPDSYNVNDLVKVGQVKKLGQNVNARLLALEGVGAAFDAMLTEIGLLTTT